MNSHRSQDSRTLYILDEIEKLLYTYGLNKVIRYRQARKEIHQTQSVAEHVTNILFCAYYFREIEDPDGTMDFDRVVRLVLMHDMGEIETGDITTTRKTKENLEEERQAIDRVIEKSPAFIGREAKEAFERFEDPKNVEERFARAMDKFEGLLFWFNEDGMRMIKEVSSHEEIVGYFEKLEKTLTELGFPSVVEYAKVIKENMIIRGL